MTPRAGGRSSPASQVDSVSRIIDCSAPGAVLDALPVAIAQLDHAGVIVLVNQAWRALPPAAWKASAAPGIGQNYPDLCEAVVDDAEAGARSIAGSIRSVLRGEAAQASGDYPCESHAGQRWFRMTATALHGESAGAVVTHADITDSRLADRDIDDGRRLLRTLIDALPDVVYTKDAVGRFVHGNQACLTSLGLDHEHDLAGKSASDIWPADVAAGMQADDLSVLRGRPVVDREDRSADFVGAPRWQLTTKVPLRNAAGDVVGLVGIERDSAQRRRADGEAQELVQRLGSSLEGLRDGFYTVDRLWRFTYVNREAERILKHPRFELLGQVLWELLPAVASPLFESSMRRAMDQQTIVELVECHPSPDCCHEVRIQPTRRGLSVYMHDVSEQLKLAGQLEQERLRLVAAQAMAKIGSWELDLVTGAVEWSEETHRILGSPRPGARPSARLFLRRVHPDDRRAFHDAFVQSLGSGMPALIEHRLLLPGAVRKTVEQRWRVFKDGGLPLRALGTCQDITERKRSERSLLDSEALATAGRPGRMGAWSWLLSEDRINWSDAVCAIHGVSAGTRPTLESALAFFTPDDNTARASLQACARQGTAFDLEAEIATAQGRHVWVRVMGEPVLDGHGAVTRIQGALQDLTECRQAEQEAGRIASLLTTTLESIADGFFTLDRQWRITLLNAKAEQLLSRSRTDLLGANLWEQFPDLLGTALEQAFRRAAAGRTAVTAEALLGHSGSWFRVNIYATENGLTVYFRNTSTERATRRQLELLEASVAQLNDIVMITEAAPVGEPGPRILFVNDAFARITGYSREEAIGKTPRLLQGPRTDRAELDRIRAALDRFEPVHAELINYRKGGEPYWIEIDIVPVGTKERGDAHFVAVERDVTERRSDQDSLRDLTAHLEARVQDRTAELNLARHAAEQASKAKSSFLATMSHEIRTPMNGVIGMIDVLQQSSLKAPQVEMVDLIRDSAYSLLRIIDDILDFSKMEAGKLNVEQRPMRLADVVDKVCSMMEQSAVNHGVRMTVFVDPEIPLLVLGDETRLRQVLVNLTGNAIKFSGDRHHRGEISLRAVLAGRHGASVTVDIVVDDNGIGIDQPTLDRLFKPFSQADDSTTRIFGGTGLGLAISDMLVRLMGGTISVDSRLHQGSTFTVRLHFTEVDAPAHPSFEQLPPASGRVREEPPDAADGCATDGCATDGCDADDCAAALPDPLLHPGRHQRLRRILVAEDNETNRQVVVRQLRLIGWDGEVAYNGREALERWRNGDFALLLTDVHMPEMDGYALAAAIRAEEPAGRRMPIVALTANALRDEELRCRTAGMDDYLSKPVRLVALRAAIERWIGCPAPTPDLRTAAPAAGPGLQGPQAAPVDPAVLAALIGDDAVAIDEVMQAFRETVSQSRRSLAEAVSSGSLQAAADTAHRLKSAARAIGAIRLGASCAVIEEMARAAKTADLRAFLPQFQTEIEAVWEYLESRQQMHR